MMLKLNVKYYSFFITILTISICNSGFSQDSTKNILNSKDYVEFNKIKSKMQYSFQDSVVVYLSHNTYGCGEWTFPSYTIEHVSSSEYFDKMEYYNRRTHVNFMSQELIDKRNEILQETKVKICGSYCVFYKLSGVLKINCYGIMMLEAYEGEITIKDNCCVND